MGLGIAMVISYLPLWWWIAVEIYRENLAAKSNHPRAPHVVQPGEPYNTDGETR